MSGYIGIGRGLVEVVIEKSVVVVTIPLDEGYIGASVGSKNNDELRAIAHSLIWILKNLDTGKIVIRGDSEYAMNIGTGKWKAKANRELATRVRSLWEEVDSSFVISTEHVRAHEGHRWNERADHLAFRAMKEELPLPLQFWKPGKR